VWIVGSGTCRRKARLEGRHTSIGSRAVAAVRFNQSRAHHHGQGPIFPLGSKAGFHSSEADDGAHLEVLVVVVDSGEDAELRQRCWKQRL
jgi:hypothetical protein